MYAIVKTGGKQYRVQEGQHLLVERLRAEDGETVSLHPLLVVDGDSMLDGEGLSGVAVNATIVGHERGPKLRIVKFKPKRGYKRRTGHRQELTRIRVESIGTVTAKAAAPKRASSHKPVVAAEPPPAVAEASAPETTATAPETTATARETTATAPETTPTDISEDTAAAADSPKPARPKRQPAPKETDSGS
jgi:large subunit ribosomal protein L21